MDERYPKDWSKISKRIIARADNCCEECGVENGALVKRRGANKREPVTEIEFRAMREKYAAVKRKYREVEKNYRAAERKAQIKNSKAAVETEHQWLEDFFSGALSEEELGLGYYAEGDFIPFDDAPGEFIDGVFYYSGFQGGSDEGFDDPDFRRAARQFEMAEKEAEHELNYTAIVLQTHHIDEDPSNCTDSNLIALCQYCHRAKHNPKNRA